MRKSNNKKTRDVTAFIYLRLSRDDNLDGESYSIGNQKINVILIIHGVGIAVNHAQYTSPPNVNF